MVDPDPTRMNVFWVWCGGPSGDVNMKNYDNKKKPLWNFSEWGVWFYYY